MKEVNERILNLLVFCFSFLCSIFWKGKNIFDWNTVPTEVGERKNCATAWFTEEGAKALLNIFFLPCKFVFYSYASLTFK